MQGINIPYRRRQSLPIVARVALDLGLSLLSSLKDFSQQGSGDESLLGQGADEALAVEGEVVRHQTLCPLEDVVSVRRCDALIEEGNRALESTLIRDRVDLVEGQREEGFHIVATRDRNQVGEAGFKERQAILEEGIDEEGCQSLLGGDRAQGLTKERVEIAIVARVDALGEEGDEDPRVVDCEEGEAVLFRRLIPPILSRSAPLPVESLAV